MAPNLGFDIPNSQSNVIQQKLHSAMKFNVAIITGFVFSWALAEKFSLTDNILQLISDGFLKTEEFLRKLNEIRDGHLHEVILFIFVWIWYWFFRTGAEKEIHLLGSLHSAAKLPESFEKYAKFHVIVFLAIGLTFSFILMAFFVNYFPLFCLFFIIVNIQDLFGNRSIMFNLRNLQKEDDNDIPITDRKRETIVKLREECYKYWLYRPQIERISLMMVANICALFIYLYIAGAAYSDLRSPELKTHIEGWFWFIVRFRNTVDGYQISVLISYGIIVVTIILNEITMIKWRRERWKNLVPIFREIAEIDGQIAAGSTQN